MTFMILGLIRLYWWIVPERCRRQCLFSETCSKYVYRQTKGYGGRAGIMAFNRRLGACRPGFQLRVRDCAFELVCRDGTIVPQSELGAVITEVLAGAGGRC